MLIKQAKTPQIPRRAPSAKAKLNTTKVLKAIMRNAVKHGLDELSASEVAKLSGLTTGAIYGRFEDHDEMAIELWKSVIKQPFKARLQRSVEHLYDRKLDNQTRNRSNQLIVDLASEVTKDFESPDEVAKLGAEFLVIAKRNLAIGEEIIPEVSTWFSEFGLSKTTNAIDNAAIAIGLSAAIGTALRTFVVKSNPNWVAITNGLRAAATNASSTATATASPPPKWVNPETDNPVRTAFINAVAEVVAKSGYANATISRIVRRANLTSGSLYNLYADKEALTDDAMEIFLNITSDAHRDIYSVATLDLRGDRGLADNFILGLVPNRRMWLDFRLECLIASRNHAPTRRIFKQSLERLRRNLGATMSDLPIEILDMVSTAEQAIGMGFTVLEPYTPHLRECDFYSIMAKLAEQNQLLQPRK